jgi:hypothetical protein
MANIVRDLPPMKTFTSSGGAAVTVPTGSLDDASSLTLFFTSSFSGTTTSAVLQVTQGDPALTVQQGSPSTAWFNLSTTLVTSSGAAIQISNISFRGIRATFTATSSQSGEIFAFISKQISV